MICIILPNSCSDGLTDFILTSGLGNPRIIFLGLNILIPVPLTLGKYIHDKLDFPDWLDFSDVLKVMKYFVIS